MQTFSRPFQKGLCALMSGQKCGIDTMLRCDNRTFRTMPGKLLLGPTGRRLSADYLEPVAGFQGRVDFIHKTNIPLIFTVGQQEPTRGGSRIASTWYPSHLHLSLDEDGVSLEEDKFITMDDVLVSVQRWVNHGRRDVLLELSAPEGSLLQPDGSLRCALELPNHGMHVTLAVRASEAALTGKGLCLPAGETREIVACAVLWEQRDGDGTAYLKRMEQLLDSGSACLARQEEEYDRWFEDVPVFSCDDELLNKTWWYRWFLLRHNYAEPNLGLMRHGMFYEGRSHKVDKTPLRSKGHEFTQLIPLSTPMHLCDCRWKRDVSPCRETLFSLLDSMDEQGFFATMMVDRRGAHYGHFAQWALYQTMLVHPDKALISVVLPGFKESFRRVLEAQRSGDDLLPVCRDHRRTGKEYQPSFWYFTGFPDNARDNSSFTPLKRVDLAAYQYRNALGLAALCRAVDDPDAGEFMETAAVLRGQVVDSMWDEEDGFFYDLHHLTGEKARVKNVTGADPLWACLADGEEYLRALDTVLSDEFATGDCFASTGRSGPVFMPQGGWKGSFFKGRNGCMWDGPSWPFTTAMVLDAAAQQSKLHGHRYDGAFGKYLRQYSLEHYKEHDLRTPYLVEHYDCVTGEALSDEVDYLHSYYIDLIVRHVCGIEPGEKGITVDPIDIGLACYTLEGLLIAGHEVAIDYRRERGYTVRVDGKVRIQDHPLGPWSMTWENCAQDGRG